LPRSPSLAALLLLVASTLFAGQASAAPTGSTAETTEEARALMVDGNAQLHAGKPAEALEKLERSFALVPSPNTELLVARALRDLGRRVDAARVYAHAEAEARRRALAGEVKYGQTEAAAHTEGTSVRAQLGTLRVHVAKQGVSLLVDGADVPLAGAGDTSLLHEPGRAEVVVRDGAAEQKQIVTVVAGTTIQMEFGGNGAPTAATMKEPAPVATVPNEASRGSSWAVPAAFIAGGVTLLGAGAFTIFGLRSESTWDDLSSRCGPSFCGPADRAAADSAKTDQSIANVGLVVGSVAAIATVAFVLISLSDSSPKARARIEPSRARSGL
jgi:hypothetical protein